MSSNFWATSSNICSSAASSINTTVTIPSVQLNNVTNGVPAGGWQTVTNTGAWQGQPNGGWGGQNGNVWVGDTVVGGTAIGVGIPYDNIEPYVPPFVPNAGDVLTTDGSGNMQWAPYIAPPSPTMLELIQQMIAQGLMEIGEDGTLRMVPAVPLPRAESKPATKIPFTYIDEEELYLEIDRIE